MNRVSSSGEAPGAALRTSYGRYLKAALAITASRDAPVGLTPKEVVWSLNKARLYRYLPVRPPEQRYPVPLLLVYALINKPFIFDLAPGRSFVEFMLQQGFDIYLLDWGAPGPEDRQTRFDDYVTQYLTRAVRKLLRLSGRKELSLLGYCVGATLAVVYAALYPQAPVRNLLLLTAPLDFTDRSEGSMALWLAEEHFDIDKMVDALGNIPGELIRSWAKLQKPMENFVGTYVTLWKHIDDEEAVRGWQAMNRWVEDVVPFAGEAFRQFVVDYFRGNKLMTGEHEIDGRRLSLSNIRASLLDVVAEYDHLVAPSQAIGIMDRVSSEDKELKIIASTHVGLMASHRAEHKLWPEIVDWLAPRSGE